jgi:hypothetical protein
MHSGELKKFLKNLPKLIGRAAQYLIGEIPKVV